MIAKLITWGETRDAAADLQVRPLDAFRIEGLGHNVDFLSAIMQHPRFRAGELTTGFIAEEYPDGFEGAATSEELKRGLAAVGGIIATADADRAGGSTNSSTVLPMRPANGPCGSPASITRSNSRKTRSPSMANR